MTEFNKDTKRNGLFAACWSNVQEALLTVECDSGRVLDANPAMAALLGCALESLPGSDFCALFPAHECARLKEILKKGRQSLSSLDDFLVLCRDDRSMPILLSSLVTTGMDGAPALLCVLRPKNNLERHQHRLATLQWALSAYAGAALALVRADSSIGLLRRICEAITSESIYVLAWVGVAEETDEKLVRIVAASGPARGYLEGMTVTWDENAVSGQGPTGRAIRSGERQIMENRDTSPIFQHWRERAAQFDIFSSETVPLNVEGVWRGALMVYASCPNAFEQVAIEVFDDLAREIGHGLLALHQKEQLEAERRHRTLAQEKLTEAFASIVSALVAAVEARDPYTAGHQGRVAEIACAIGREMGWDEDRLTGLRMAAMVHDIGKISIPSRILVKPGKLSEEERNLLCTHPDIGYAILKDIPFDLPIAEIMRQHHEKMDGSGYPRGLQGDQILPEARVLTVADIVEAMASDRPYRDGIPLPQVLEEIERQAGLQLDDVVVKVCAQLIREERIEIRTIRGAG